MQLTVQRADAVSALSRIAGVVEKRNTIPLLSHALLEAENDLLSIRATDLDMEITCRIAADIGEPGAATADAKVLFDAANASPAGGLALSLNGKLALKAGKSKFNLATLPPEDFPSIGGDEWAVQFDITAPVLRALLASTAFAAARTESWALLTGVRLEADAGDLVAIASNRKRLAFRRLAAPAGAKDMPAVSLPKKVVDTLVRLLADRDDDIAVSVSRFKVAFKAEDFDLTSKVIEGEFFPWQAYVAKTTGEAARACRVRREDLLLAIRRAQVGANADQDGIGIKLNLSPGAIKVTGRGQDNDAADEIGADYDGPEVSMGYQSGFLADALSNIAGETVALQFNDADSNAPLIITDPEDPSVMMHIGRRVVG